MFLFEKKNVATSLDEDLNSVIKTFDTFRSRLQSIRESCALEDETIGVQIEEMTERRANVAKTASRAQKIIGNFSALMGEGQQSE